MSENKDTYAGMDPDTLILRDHLAIDRTALANERTLLAYLRAAAALLLAGASMLNFATSDWFGILGIVCLPVGIAVGAVGIARFVRMNRAIARIRTKIDG